MFALARDFNLGGEFRVSREHCTPLPCFDEGFLCLLAMNPFCRDIPQYLNPLFRNSDVSGSKP